MQDTRHPDTEMLYAKDPETPAIRITKENVTSVSFWLEAHGKVFTRAVFGEDGPRIEFTDGTIPLLIMEVARVGDWVRPNEEGKWGVLDRATKELCYLDDPPAKN